MLFAALLACLAINWALPTVDANVVACSATISRTELNNPKYWHYWGHANLRQPNKYIVAGGANDGRAIGEFDYKFDHLVMYQPCLPANFNKFCYERDYAVCLPGQEICYRWKSTDTCNYPQTNSMPGSLDVYNQWPK